MKKPTMGNEIIKNPFLKVMDHSALKPDVNDLDAERYVQEVLKYNLRGTCFRPSQIPVATMGFKGTEYKNSAVVCFPTGKFLTIKDMNDNIEEVYVKNRGYRNLETARLYEIEKVINEGANEIDMIIDLVAAVNNNHFQLFVDIKTVKNHLPPDVALKVIECAPFFNDEQLWQISKTAIAAGANYLKTTTGYGPRSASLRDVNIFANCLREHDKSGRVGIKAAGGIKNLEQAAAFYGMSQAFGPRKFIIGESSYEFVDSIETPNGSY